MSARHVGDDRYDRDLPVLILKTKPQPFNHGTLGVIRSFGRAGVPVYCSREPGGTPVAASRYLGRERIGLLPVTDRRCAITELRNFQRRLDRPLTIVPFDENAAQLLAEARELLGENFRLPRQPADLPRRIASKANYPQLCAQTETPTPRTVVLQAGDDFAEATTAIRYPAVVKIGQPWLLPVGLRPTLMAHDADTVLQYRAQLAHTDATIVVQEFIPHDVSEDWFYHGYHAAGGEAVVGFTGRKLRSHPAFIGATAYGVSLVNEDVLSLSRKFLRTFRYAGIVELEFRFDRRDGEYKLIDINPRLGAQFQFLRNTAGVDIVRALQLDMSGRPVPDAPQIEGCTFVSDFTDLAAFGEYRRRGQVSAGVWLKQLVTANEHAWWATDDLAPFAAASVQFLRNRLRRRSTRPQLQDGRGPLGTGAATSQP